jgi:hypothetical protein
VDDLTFSAAFSMRTWIPFIQRVFAEYGLRIHQHGDKRPYQFGPGESPTICGLSIHQGRITISASYVSKVREELAGAIQIRADKSVEPLHYGRESYWGMIQYVRRFSPVDADRLLRLFNQVRWNSHSELPSKKGKIVYDTTP